MHILFHSLAQHSPLLKNAGPMPLSETTKLLSKQLANSLRQDEWHALVHMDRSDVDRHMTYQTLRYSDMLALRQLKEMPCGLSATALIVSLDGQRLLWQKRAESSHLFPGFLSLLGGGFNPRMGDDLGDDDDPRNTAVREVWEEAGVQLQLPINSLVSVTQETNTGAVQINFLGVVADFSQARAEESEGLLVEMPVPRLSDVATLPGFTDLAKANVLAWLLSRNV